MRYENKFVLPAHAYASFHAQLLASRFFFSEIYQERRVNNIYLDTEDYRNLFDNLRGIQNRRKHRIRWYGDSGNADQPVLEYKIKQGALGYKEYYRLPGISLDASFDYTSYLLLVQQTVSQVTPRHTAMVRDLSAEVPTLFNSYLRRYFLSADGDFRITIDRDLEYGAINRWFAGLPGFQEDKIVIELKHEKSGVSHASAILQELGLRLSRNSKYVIGMQGLYFNLFA